MKERIDPHMENAIILSLAKDEANPKHIVVNKARKELIDINVKNKSQSGSPGGAR